MKTSSWSGTWAARRKPLKCGGQYAYVGFGTELAILDVSDPAHVHRVGWLVAEGEVMDIAIQGDYAYIAYERQGGDIYGRPRVPGLQIVDIRRPALPAALSVKEFGNCSVGVSVVHKAILCILLSQTVFIFWASTTGKRFHISPGYNLPC